MKLIYGNGNIIIKDVKPIRGLQINFMGNIQSENKSNAGWMLRIGNRTMIFYNMNLNPQNIGEEILEYRGNLKIDSVIAADMGGNKISVEVVKEVDEYDSLNETWSKVSKDWDKLNVGLKKVGNKGRLHKRKVRHISRNKVRSETITYNLNASKDRFKILETNETYNGKYHLHGDGTMMTGATHTKESKEIVYSEGKIETLTPEKVKEIRMILETGGYSGRTADAPPMTGGETSGGGGAGGGA